MARESSCGRGIPDNIIKLSSKLIEMRRKYNMGTLISAAYTTNLKNVEENMLTAGTISLPLSKAYWLGTDETSSTIRALYLQMLSDLYHIHGMNEAEADSLAAQFGNLFTALAPAQLNSEDYYNPEKTYNVYKVSDLENFFNGKLSVETLCRLFEAEPEDEVVIQEPVSFEKNALDNTVAMLSDFANRVYVENCFDETVNTAYPDE